MKRKFPLGLSDFESIRERGMVYIDKTSYLQKLLDFGVPIFLSRPRRFGKSLFVTMTKAFFEGKRELFEGLSIAKHAGDWSARPVIHLDMSDGTYETEQSAFSTLTLLLKPYEKRYSLPYPPSKDLTLGGRLKEIIQAAYEVTGKKVVILIDEYDYPLLSDFPSQSQRKKVRGIIDNFFSCLKPNLPIIEFLFITGITKFSQAGIFSKLNNLVDISLDPSYEGICGITENELLTDLAPDVQNMAHTRGQSFEEVVGDLKEYYDGYHFGPLMTDIYNPLSVSSSLHYCSFGNYWFATATPSYLVSLVKSGKFDAAGIEGKSFDLDELNLPPEAAPSILPLLLQSGYLTYKEYPRDGSSKCVIDFPNNEVKKSFYGSLISFSGIDLAARSQKSTYSEKAIPLFAQGRVEEAMEETKVLFSAFSPKTPKGIDREVYFQTIWYGVFASVLGFDASLEDSSSTGYADIVLRFPRFIYIIETKTTMSPKAALSQIEEKGYDMKYASDGRIIIKLGVKFSVKTRNVEAWEMALR